jgi:hypothetical protein
MIPVFLWSMRWRFALIAVLCILFYLWEPGFHFHEEPGPDTPIELLDPATLAFTLSNLAGASVLVLLAGFVAADRRRGYYRMYFSHPTRPLAYYGVRWLLSYLLAVAVAALFLVFGQLAAWGEMRVGPGALLHPALFALVYGGLTAFLSVVLPRGDSLVALGIFAVTEIWQGFLQTMATVGADPVPGWVRGTIPFLLPPHVALTDVFSAWQAGGWAWGALIFAAGYGLFWLLLAGLLLHLREWP